MGFSIAILPTPDFTKAMKNSAATSRFFCSLYGFTTVSFNIKPAVSCDCKISTRRMCNQQIPLAYLVCFTIHGTYYPTRYGSECVTEDMPFRMTAGRLLYITGVRFVSARPERLAYRLRFLASN